MRVGLVRNVALGMVALVGLGLAGCDDNPTDFEPDETVRITTNPSLLTLPAGVTALVASRTENAGNEPTWEEISASVDGSCGSGAITVDVAATYEPSLQPPGQFDVTAGNTLGATCIQLSGGGANATVEVNVVGDSLAITDVPATETVDLFGTADLSGALFSRASDPVGPFDADADLAWSSDDTAVLTVDPATGVVTSVGVGAANITATWTDAGATVTASTPLTTNAPALAIVPADPDSLLIDTTVDLSATLTDPTDPPATFGPFDPETDVTWSTSDDDIVDIDEVTGEATAVGPGTATITAMWSPSIVVDEEDAIINNPVMVTASIDVDVPAPTLATAAPPTGNLGELITVTGAGFNEAMSIFVDGAELESVYEPTIVDATTATFHLPFGAVDDVNEDVSIVVGTAGQLSDPVTVSRTFTDETDEPNNDDPGTAPDVVLPVDIWGAVDPADVNDFFAFTLAVETTFDLFLDWDQAATVSDLDLIITNESITEFPCFAATAGRPESASCTLPAGDWILWVNNYAGPAAVYHVVASP